LAYEGTDFAGWQRQAKDRSVQAELEAALAPIEGRHVTVSGAGRTDAGVHALGQVASFSLTAAISCRQLQRALNATLREDVRVISAEEAADGFNARFSARSKTYRYRISNTSVISPFHRRFALHISRKLDLALMQEAAAELVGRHDFSAFRAAARTSPRRTPVRTMTVSQWLEEPLAHGGRLLVYEIAGNGFLKYMVRNIVGTLIEVGDRKRSPMSMREILASRNRSAAGPTAPPHGLYLVRVDYDPAGPVSFL
jgi:tRNA pseudouridine38-40 synthase